MANLERYEIFLDDSPQPWQVLAAPHNRLRLETERLADGEHLLRIVAVYGDGRRQERRLSFTFDAPSGIRVDGLAPGEIVRGPIELSLEPSEAAPPQPARGATLFRIVATLVVLGGVWALFAFLSPLGDILAPAGGPSKGSEDAGGGAAASPAQMRQGELLFSLHCAACHGQSGAGIPGTFPPLAGNPCLQNSQNVVTTIHRGLSGPIVVGGQRYHGQMPAFAQLSPEQIAAVATYVRNSFGNRFGELSTADVERTLGAPDEGGAAAGGR